jgi:hypothetical protein
MFCCHVHIVFSLIREQWGAKSMSGFAMVRNLHRPWPQESYKSVLGFGVVGRGCAKPISRNKCHWQLYMFELQVEVLTPSGLRHLAVSVTRCDCLPLRPAGAIPAFAPGAPPPIGVSPFCSLTFRMPSFEPGAFAQVGSHGLQVVCGDFVACLKRQLFPAFKLRVMEACLRVMVAWWTWCTAR